MGFATVGELAERVHIRVPALEEGFKKYLDASPMTYPERQDKPCTPNLQLADPPRTLWKVRPTAGTT